MAILSEETRDLERNLAPQTKLAAVSYAILLLAMLFTNTQNNESYITNIVVFAIVSLLSLYTINCVVKGTCNVYAWIFAYVVLANAILVLLFLIGMYV